MKAILIKKSGYIVTGDLKIINGESSFDADPTFIKSLKDIEDFSSYKSFIDFNELLGLTPTKKQVSDYLRSLGAKELYFYDPLPGDTGVKEFKEYWFKYNNNLCSRCINECKQSSRVKIVNCREFKENK